MEKQNKIKSSKIIVCFLVLFIFSIANAQEKIPDGLEDRIDQIRKDWKIPGMAVAIIKDDKVTGEESQMKAGYGQTKGLLYYKYIK